ncbi:MAG: tryptophan synthase subunit alpha [Coriobacteriaceae bacterium]|jgi:tryptophan synthase alpha chain|nr:tryptophan synthase subunit alpha [Coriobacteriaceae bacterium]
MSRTAQSFAHGKAFIGFITAGDPSIQQTEEYVFAMAEAGADLIELGIPFSDPIAEGPVIQGANVRALAAGTRLRDVFSLVERIRMRTEVPLALMGYLNPLFHYGYEAFFTQCQKVGVDAVIIADLPYEEKAELSDIASRYGVDVISMVAPTSLERVERIAATATGFIYLVSSLGVTGERRTIDTDLEEIIAKIRGVSDVPIAIGFGVHTPDQARELASKADGVIVGSALVRMIADSQEGSLKHEAQEGAPQQEGALQQEGAQEHEAQELAPRREDALSAGIPRQEAFVRGSASAVRQAIGDYVRTMKAALRDC